MFHFYNRWCFVSKFWSEIMIAYLFWCVTQEVQTIWNIMAISLLMHKSITAQARFYTLFEVCIQFSLSCGTYFVKLCTNQQYSCWCKINMLYSLKSTPPPKRETLWDAFYNFMVHNNISNIRKLTEVLEDLNI